MEKRERRMTARDVVRMIREAPFEEVEELLERYGADERAQVRAATSTARRRHERERAERSRVSEMYRLEAELSGGGVVLGVDEVGRGAIAGPLTVCAVALPAEPLIWGLNDSKQLTPARREALAAEVAQHAVAIGLAHIEPASIDAVGMGHALRMGMSQAIEAAGVEPDAVLIDGREVHVHPREVALVKGDARVASIAAASIVAKVTRDALMVAYARTWPAYHLDACKGYGSAEHIAALREHGPCPLHRISFCGNFLERPQLF